MSRGHVIHRVVLVPMQICTQQEEDKTIAVMPAWALPNGLIESGRDQASAIESLRQRMAEYWEGRKK